LNFNEAVRWMENLLSDVKVSFTKTVNQDSVVFDNIQIGDRTVVVVLPNSIHIIIRLKEAKEITKMRRICKSLKANTPIACDKKNKGKIHLYNFRIDMEQAPEIGKKTFISVFQTLRQYFGREISPFVLGIVTSTPDKFFIDQYKLWKSIPPEEQSQMFEDILIIKEKYFRSTKTKKGIIAKLNKMKVMLAEENENLEEKQLLRIVFGEDFTGSFEFYYIDFAALFRAIELGFLRLKLTDFFDNFNTKGGNR
jgi:hypothetical protein